MSYHETFWVVAGTAAPVIALAALVAVPDTSGMYRNFAQSATDEFETVLAKHRSQDPAQSGKSREAQINEVIGDELKLAENERAVMVDVLQGILRPLRYIAAVIRWGAIGNVLVQAGLLGVSLTALAYDRDVMPLWVAIVLAVGGIVLLAVTVSVVPQYRGLNALWSEELKKFKRPHPDDG